LEGKEGVRSVEEAEQKTREGGNLVSDRCGGNCMRQN